MALPALLWVGAFVLHVVALRSGRLPCFVVSTESPDPAAYPVVTALRIDGAEQDGIRIGNELRAIGAAGLRDAGPTALAGAGEADRVRVRHARDDVVADAAVALGVDPVPWTRTAKGLTFGLPGALRAGSLQPHSRGAVIAGGLFASAIHQGPSPGATEPG